MRKMVKELGKKENKGEADVASLHPRLRSVLEAINTVPSAKKALRDLRNAGCDEKAVARDLFYYCGGTQAEVAAGLKVARSWKAELTSAANRLNKDADLVERMIRRLRPMMEIHGETLPANLREFATILSIASKSWKKSTRSVESGRNQHLVYLIYLVKAATGHKHYLEIAKLVSAVRKEIKPDYIALADALRKKVTRYEKDISCFELEQAAYAEYEHWRA